MAPPRTIKAPKLPLNLLRELGQDGIYAFVSTRNAYSNYFLTDEGPRNGRGRRGQQVQSRKDRRRAERTQKKAHRATSTQKHQKHQTHQAHARAAPVNGRKTESHTKPPATNGTNGTKAPLPATKPILKKSKQPQKEDEDEDDDEDMSEDEVGDEDLDLGLDEGSDEDDEEGFDSDDDDEDDGLDELADGLEDDDEDEEMFGEDDGEEEAAPKQPKISKALRKQIEQDEKEAAELERKLGLKGRKNLPKSFKDDGLADLLEGIDGVQTESGEKRKRKAEADEWLAQKRRKAVEEQEKQQKQQKKQRKQAHDSDSELDGDDDDDDGMDLDGSDFGSDDEDGDMGEDGSDDFGGFDSEDGDEEEGEPEAKPRVRENPYVAPTTNTAPAKYVPPSLRKEALGSDAALAARIRRQSQGYINRITEANLVSIVGDFEKLYRDSPRQHVTSSIVDLLLVQICEPTALPDTLLILWAGFATAVCKIIGMDFGAQLIQEAVERFDKFNEEAKELAASGRIDVPKQTSNLITFLSELYNFQVVGPNLLFDFIRILLENLSELNAELLLRIIRMCGPSLRHDDPMALKDIVTLIRPAVAKIGEANLSVRTRFMIDTINDLKNNKLKAGAGASAVVAEHTGRMKKLLGSLKAKNLKSTEPLRLTLKDIRESDKKGKWWLVGASWAGNNKAEEAKKQGKEATRARDDDDDKDSFVLDSDFEEHDTLPGAPPDLLELAREQGMNTDVRRSIFVSVLSATDYEDAYFRILKLRLNKERQREIPYVIMQCAGAEMHYNPYYTLVARKFCQGDRRLRWAFQDGLWKLFKRLGESLFGEEVDDADVDQDDEGEDAMSLRRLVNLAKMFGTLVGSGTLGLSVLKCLNLPYLQKKTKSFVEVMLITAMLESVKGEDGEKKDKEAAITKVFASAASEGGPELARGLQWFIRKVLRKTDLFATKAEEKIVTKGCATAKTALERSLAVAEGLVG